MSHNFAESLGNPTNTFVLPFVMEDKVKEAVRSIWRCHVPQEHRLILIDGIGMQDFKDRKWLMENCHIYINSYRNLGPAVAFNLGIEMARTKYVTITSDDARLIHNTWFVDNIKYLDENPNQIVSTSSIFQHVHPEDFYVPNKEYTFEDYNDLDRKYGMRIRGFELTAAVSFKETWEKVNLFPEQRYSYLVDRNLSDAAEAHGVECIKSGVIFHYGDASHRGKLEGLGRNQPSGLISEERLAL